MPRDEISILSYERLPAAASRLTLNQTDGGFTLTFPVPRAWPIYLGLVIGLLTASFIAAVGIYVFKLMIRGGPLSVAMLPVLLLPLSGCAYLAAAVFGVIQHRRFGHVGRSLTVRDGKLMHRYVGSWNIREVTRNMEEIRWVRWKSLRSLVPRQPAAEMRIRIARDVLPLIFRFTGYKVVVGKQFHDLLEQAIDHCKQKEE